MKTTYKTYALLCYVQIFVFFQMTFISSLDAAEYAVPNNGSPYISIESLKQNQIINIPTGVKVTKDQMLDDISASRVIYVAETHDNIESHRVQLEIIKNIYLRNPGGLAVGMEMFRRPAQDSINKWLKDELSEYEFFRMWYSNWGEGYENYDEILRFIKKNNIPVVALKPDKNLEIMYGHKKRDISLGSGIHGLPDIDETDEYHKAYAQAVFSGHGNAKHAGIFNPYPTLLLWEETMAESIVNYLNTTSGKNKKMVVLAGSFHVEYGFGIPKRAFRRMPHNYSIVLTEAASVSKETKEEIASRGQYMEVAPTNIPLLKGDYAWVVDYKLLKKKNLTLGVMLNEAEGGLNIVSIEENSNASMSGMAPGDIIVTMDGINVKSVVDVKALLHTKKPGDHLRITLLREKKEISMDMQFRIN